MSNRASFIFLLSFLICLEAKSMSPKKTYEHTPDSLYLTFEDIYIKTTDSFDIHVWFMPSPPSLDNGKTIIIAGSDAGNMSNYLIHAYKLVLEGYTVVTFDYRGFGSSDSFDCTGKMLYYNEFVTDLNRVYAFTKEKKPNDRVGFWGFSMGTIIGTMAYNTSPFDFMLLDGLVTNPFITAIRLGKSKEQTFLLPDSADTYKLKTETLTCPILVFAGLQDEITTVKDAKSFCSYSKNRKLLKHKGNHLESMSIMSKKHLGDIYFKHSFNFLKKI